MRTATAKTPALLVTASLIAAGIVITAAMLGGIFSMTPAFAQQQKVRIIHFPDGNPENFQILCVGPEAARHHFENHEGDDLLGPC
jgi:hypothetical protein